MYISSSSQWFSYPQSVIYQVCNTCNFPKSSDFREQKPAKAKYFDFSRFEDTEAAVTKIYGCYIRECSLMLSANAAFGTLALKLQESLQLPLSSIV